MVKEKNVEKMKNKVKRNKGKSMIEEKEKKYKRIGEKLIKSFEQENHFFYKISNFIK